MKVLKLSHTWLVGIMNILDSNVRSMYMEVEVSFLFSV